MASSAEKLMKDIQKIASKTQIDLQKLANQATEKSFKYNKEEASAARAWQKEMSDTAHQREVKDLRAAGLNPVLSANSGAQSYTTSAASAQANDPSSSYASIAGDVIQSRTGAYQADTSAAATRKAAGLSAAATRYAADSNLKAAQAAASAQMYSADKSYAAAKYKADKDFEKAMNQPANTKYALADKYFSKIIGSNAAKKAAKNALEFMNNDFKEKNPTKNKFTLNGQGIINANRGVRKLGLKPNDTYRNLYVKAFVFNDSRAAYQLSRASADAKKTKKVNFNRSGSGVW